MEGRRLPLETNHRAARAFVEDARLASCDRVNMRLRLLGLQKAGFSARDEYQLEASRGMLEGRWMI